MPTSVGGTEPATSVHYAGSTSSEKSKGLSVDTETFLKLLVAQLQYQDPLEPQTDTQFVTQLAQMTSLEQMQKMNATLTSSQAYDMIGKYVYAEVLNEKTGMLDCYFGLVDSVLLKDGEAYVVIGESAVSVSDVSRIFDGPDGTSGTESDTVQTPDADAGSG
mgnify:CR=1 FL=1